MRVLFLSSLYPRPGRNLACPFNRLQLTTLARHHQVAAVVPVAWTERLGRPRELFRPSLPIVRDGVTVWHPTYFYPPRVGRNLYGQCFLTSIRATVRRVIDNFRPDVLFACWAHPDGWAAIRFGRAANLPVVLKVIGSDLLIAGQESGRRSQVSESLGTADAVIAVSEHLASHAKQLGGVHSRVSVVPEGTDLDLFSPGDRTTARQRLGLSPHGPLILFVGNLLTSKGVRVLAEACGRLATGGVNFSCWLVGRGPDANAVRTIAARWGITDRLTLAGPRPQSELPDWYRASDVVTLPSFSEGSPNVLREAIACGVPFVATQVGGIPELVRGPAGQLVPCGDPTALAEALSRTIAAPPTVTADHRAVNIGWAESAARLERILTKVIRERVVPTERR